MSLDPCQGRLTLQPFVYLGGEGSGLSPELRDLCDLFLTVPARKALHPAVDSLNVSVATGTIWSTPHRPRVSALILIPFLSSQESFCIVSSLEGHDDVDDHVAGLFTRAASHLLPTVLNDWIRSSIRHQLIDPPESIDPRPQPGEVLQKQLHLFFEEWTRGELFETSRPLRGQITTNISQSKSLLIERGDQGPRRLLSEVVIVSYPEYLLTWNQCL